MPANPTPDLARFAADAVERHSGVREPTPSGPTHDSAEIARAGVPTAMLFLPSVAGLSHTADDIEFGVATFDELVRWMLPWASARLGGSGTGASTSRRETSS